MSFQRRPAFLVEEGEAATAALDDSAPKSLPEMFQWAEAAWLQLSDECKERVSTLTKQGIDLLTFYSGKGTAESIFQQIFQTVAGTSSDGLRVLAACDRSPVCRQALMSLVAGGPKHLFGDICSRVPPEMQEALQRLEPSETDEMEHKAASYEEMRKLLFNGQCFSHKSKSHCFVHGQYCGLWEGLEPDTRQKSQKLVVVVAGASCTDFSRRRTGPCPKLSGKTTKPFFIFLAEVKCLGPDLFFYENVPNWPVEQLQEWLPAYENFYVRVSPDSFGYPMSRPRVFGVLMKKERIVFSGSTDDFYSLQTALAASGDIYFHAPDAAVRSSQWRRAKGRGNVHPHVNVDASSIPLTDQVTPTTFARYLEYEKLRHTRQGVDGSFLADLDQNPQFGSCGPILPSLPTHNSVFSFSRGRFLLGTEFLAAMGENIYLADARTPSTFLSRAFLERTSEKDLNYLAGNAFHMPLMGRFIFFVLGHIHQLPSMKLLKCVSDFGARSSSFLLESQTSENAPPQSDSDAEVNDNSKKKRATNAEAVAGAAASATATATEDSPLRKRPCL